MRRWRHSRRQPLALALALAGGAVQEKEEDDSEEECNPAGDSGRRGHRRGTASGVEGAGEGAGRRCMGETGDADGANAPQTQGEAQGRLFERPRET